MRNGTKLCAISHKLISFVFGFLYLYFAFENNESHNFASEYSKQISLISSILNVTSCCTKYFICKVQTDKFCCLRNTTVFQSDKDICVLCIGQAQNRAKAVGGNRQQTPRFQFSSLASCLLLALFWLLGF